LTTRSAYATFQHAPIELLNPGHAYDTTQALADRVRAYTSAHHPRAEGIKSPSVRTPPAAGYQPSQYALFVMRGLRLNGQIAWGAKLTLEFLDGAGNPVAPTTRLVDWTHPRFQLQGLPAPISAFAPRPGSQPYHQGQWYPAEIRAL